MRDTSGKQNIRNRGLSDKRNIKKTGDTSDKRDIGRSIGRPHRTEKEHGTVLRGERRFSEEEDSKSNLGGGGEGYEMRKGGDVDVGGKEKCR